MLLSGIKALSNAGSAEESSGEIAGGRFIDNLPPDKPGEEMTKEARVWKTYVWETDRWDKELVGGRNSTLDVLLIFAALFSAISTAFLIVSITDLKPDYTESSAQTLLVIAQMLAAQASPQNASLMAPSPPDAHSFSPSSTAVLVNSLWMLSLSLSVAVSLIAMLAKDWCYKFTFNRSGPAYEQARRRQRKWNGIEKWKMNEVLTYLPGVLHLALLLFAIGLCLYLWDINVTVAIPVVVVTGSATLAYILATILPYVDHTCPYSTPASGIFTAINKFMTPPLVVLAGALMAIMPDIKHALKALDLIPSVIDRIPEELEGLLSSEGSAVASIAVLSWNAVSPSIACLVGLAILIIPIFVLYLGLRLLWVPVTLVRVSSIWTWKLFNSLTRLCRFLRKVVLDTEHDDAYSGKDKAPMDSLTSQMLAWIISNCEDSRSVGTALQAIAGADHNLPHQPLTDCKVFELVSTRLGAYIEWDNKSKNYVLKDPSQLLITLRYCRAYSVLTFGNAHQTTSDGDSAYYGKDLKTPPSSDLIRIHSIYTDLLKQAQGKAIHSDATATAAAVAMPFSDWNWSSRLDRPSLAPEAAFNILATHLQSDCTLLSASSLVALAEFIPHYLLWAWSKEEQLGDSQCLHHLLSMMLAQLFFKYHSTEPEIARSSAIALASAALAINNCSGGERPPKGASDRKKRAAQVLQHYLANPPNGDTIPALFIFGFYGLLPHFNLNLINEHLPDLPSYLDNVLQVRLPQFGLQDDQIRVHSIPPYALQQYVLNPALDHLASFAQDTSNVAHQMTTAFRLKLLPFLFHTSQLADDVNTRIYGLALIALCRTKYKALQDLCMSIIDKQPVPVGPLAPSSSGNTGEDIWMNIRNTVEEREENRKRMGAVKNVAGLLGRLCAVLMASETPVVPVAILHFELLVACVVSSGARPLKELQFTLRLLLSSCGEFAGLKGSGPLSLENLFAYLETGRNERRTRGDMLRIMQYVADFCDHGLGPDQAPDELSGDSRKDAKQAKVDWHTKLVELKNAYKPGAARIEHSNPGDAASSSSSNRDGSVSREAVANSP